MSGGFPLLMEMANQASVGTSTSASTGTSVTSGTANTKGSWTQLIASTTYDAQWMAVTINCQPAGKVVAVDIGIGAASSELVVASNLNGGSEFLGCYQMVFPCQIPSGSRIAARSQCATGSTVCQVSVDLLDTDYGLDGATGVLNSYGFSTSTSLGTVVTASASANTKGSWAQLTASTSTDIAGFFVTCDDQNTNSTTAITHLTDIGIGAGGSEIVVLSNLAFVNSFGMQPSVKGPYFVNIPSGTRLAARTQCSATGSKTCGIYILAISK